MILIKASIIEKMEDVEGDPEFILVSTQDDFLQLVTCGIEDQDVSDSGSLLCAFFMRFKEDEEFVRDLAEWWIERSEHFDDEGTVH